MRIGLGITGGRSTSPIQRTRAAIAATKGGVWRFGDSSAVFESADATDPAESGDGIQYMLATITGTVATLPVVQSSVGLRPVWQGSYADFASGARLEGSGSTLGIFQNVGAATVGWRGRITSLSASQTLLAWSQGAVSTNPRIDLLVSNAGEVRVRVARIDGDALTTILSAGSLITAGTDVSIIATVDFATGGAGAIRGYINNGSDVLNGTLAATGSTSNTASLASRIGTLVNDLNPLTGRTQNVLAANFIPTTEQRTDLFSVLSL